MPEGDALRRAAARLQPLVGERLEVEAPHPRAAAKGIAERLDGLRLESVTPVGKNLLLRFEGGLVLRSHLRMNGRWRLDPRGARRVGRPWLVLRGATHEGVLWNGPVLELRADGRVGLGLGPDILDDPPDLDAMLANLRAADPSRELGEALLDQRLVAGIGNIWKAESLWEARLSPWSRVGELTDADLDGVFSAAARLMRESVRGFSRPNVYRRRVCPRCGGRIEARGQGDDNRTTWWCPGCQGGEPASAA